MTTEQSTNLNTIISQTKNTGYSAEEAFIAAWIANSESSLGIKNTGAGTISGIYQYSDSTWKEKFYKYGSDLGFGSSETELERWMTEKDSTDLQITVLLKNMGDYETELDILKRGGVEAENLLSSDLRIKKAWDRMKGYGIPDTFEDYVYMRHNTNPKEVLKENYDRLLDLDGSYAIAEKAVEAAYGQQVTDTYANPSLTPLLQKLADAVHLDISGMTNQEALGWIRERYNRLPSKSVSYLLECLSGKFPLETSKLWQYWHSLFATATTTRSPIILDINGDGIKTLGTDAGIHFDHDGNGFKELSGWVAPGDGMLMLDRDADGSLDNGSELFGNFTPLANGMLAVNGFQALAQFDTNGDGKIDASDPIWSQLKVWQHDPEATDLGDPDSSGIFKTLDELGIQSIDTGYTNSTLVDANGNAHKQISTFTSNDGSTNAATDVWFQTDNMYTIANDWLDVPEDIAALPDLQGYGNVIKKHAKAPLSFLTGDIYKGMRLNTAKMCNV